MSYDRLRAIRDSGLPATQRAIAVAVSLRCDDFGETFASAATIAHDTGHDERTVRRALTSLVESGVLSRHKRTGTSDVLRFGIIPVEQTPGAVSPRAPRPPTPDTTPGVPRAQRPPTPGTAPYDQSTDQSSLSVQGSAHSDSAREEQPLTSKPFSVETPTALSPNKNKNTAGAKNLIAAAYMLEIETYPDRYRDVPFGRPPSLRTPKCEKAIARAARDGVTPEDLETLWAYMHKSDERDPAWYRSDPTLMFWGSIYNDNGMTRMSAARAWALRGHDIVIARDIRGPPPRAANATAINLFAADQYDNDERHGGRNGVRIIDTDGYSLDAGPRDRGSGGVDG